MSTATRLVHLDLKGAPLKVSYYQELFPLLRTIGATGLLIEYEDMFPYHGNLKDLKTADAYSQESIEEILLLAKISNLLVVPLVQSIGHLEFVLKCKKFWKYREVSRYPNSLCPSLPESSLLVQEMVEQVIQLHPDVRWFHIGADEVWHLGWCDRCKHIMSEKHWGVHHLFLNYITGLVRILKDRYPFVHFIIWDDMLRSAEPQIIAESGIQNLVEPMVWHYLPKPKFELKQPLWQKYLTLFPKVWIASAFKGATQMNQLLCPPAYHLSNQEAWLEVLQEHSHYRNSFMGIALTGWQRFDHFTVLCELFPLALPCLALCLKMIINGSLTSESQEEVAQTLGYFGSIDLEVFPRPRPVPPVPNFPGGQLYVNVHNLSNITSEADQLMSDPSVLATFHEFHRSINRTNPLHIDQFSTRARLLHLNLEALYNQLKNNLDEIYYSSTVNEWLMTYIQPYRDKLRKLVNDADLQIAVHVPM